MNAVPPPLLPDDEATDPLLAGLRQRLGDYGQAPPPGAWAAIQQRIHPAPPPAPWWRRRHLLAVLGLLLGCLLLPSKLGKWAGLRLMHERSIAAKHPSLKHTASRFSPANASDNPAVSPAANHAAAIPATEAGALPGSATRSSAFLPTLKASVAATLSLATKTTAAPAAHAASSKLINRNKQRTAASAFVAGASHRGHQLQRLRATTGEGHKTRAQRPGRWPAPELAESVELAALTARAKRLGTSAVAIQRAALPGIQTRRSRAAEATALRPATALAVAAGPATGLASEKSRAVQQARHARQAPGSSAIHSLPAAAAEVPAATDAAAGFLPSLFQPAGPLDLVAPRLPGLPLPAAGPLATLVARPDSAPAALPVRRWALLVLAGPTVSYRTLGPAPTLAAGHPDFARLERPALGLGAQVQVRRVLSGRWALAVGVGYHEYATRLALSLKDTFSLHQRDTYRLLTVPVQLSYALGVPKSRLSKALLLGAEPGWYLGGRSTEGSGCGCEQRAYASAAGSPYRSLSVAFSLGLDLRYRLGGAGGRGQWLVQPTGRYVATPFLGSDAGGFTTRQPFSLGLLTGFSWDVR